MHILQVASEITPIAKVGGLGDVLMGLTRELSWNGHETLAVIPFYGVIDTTLLKSDEREEWFTTTFDGIAQRACVRYFHVHNDLSVALLDTENGFFRNRNSIYGGDDGAASFLIFCRAVAEWLVATGRQPDIIHIHDWPTALLPVIYQKIALVPPSCKTVLTVHNFEHQGRCAWEDLNRVGIYRDEIEDPTIFKDPLYDCVNLVKAGLLTADFVTTVSPTYAREVLNPECGMGLETVLASLGNRFKGILNGVDYAFWNPEIDPYIDDRYGNSDGTAKITEAKHRNREKLLSTIGIPLLPDVPMIASVTRLVTQKGVWMLKDLFDHAQSLNFQCLILGSVAEPDVEQAFTELDAILRSSGRGAVFLKSDEALAHKAYAASDIFVAPSIFEPCGLTQLIALKYGTIPIVRRTGGLADTITDVRANLPSSNGFLFENPNSTQFTQAALRALALFHNKSVWEKLMVQGMNQDFSWHQPGKQYVELYQTLLQGE